MDSDEYPAEERRHQQPGRRGSDAYATALAARVEADGDVSILPAGWTVNRVTKWLGLMVLLATVVGAVITFFSARFATRAEVTEIVKPVADSQAAFQRATMSDLRGIKERQDDAESIHRLIVPMARLQCLQMRKWDSGTLADAAGLPCDSLLRRVR